MEFNDAARFLAVRRRMVGRPLNDEWDRIWEEEVVGCECIKLE
jgi:hypothetical protein